MELGEELLSSVLPPLTEVEKAEVERRSQELRRDPKLALSEDQFWSEVMRLEKA